MAAAEASSRAGPAGEESAGGVAGEALGWPGLQVRPGLFAKSSQGSPRLVQGRDPGMGVMTGVRPPASPGELRRPRLLAAPPRPCSELPLEGLFRPDLLRAMLDPGGDGWSAPSLVRPATL